MANFFRTELVTIAVFFLTVKKPIFKWNEHIKKHVKLKIIPFSLIIIYYFICHSIACICKFPLKNTCKFTGRIFRPKKWFFKLLFYFLSVKGYSNPYDGDFRVCHVSKLWNSKNIPKIEYLAFLLFNCRFRAPKMLILWRFLWNRPLQKNSFCKYVGDKTRHKSTRVEKNWPPFCQSAEFLTIWSCG